MKIYMVGGAVRDALLGLPVKDHDYVVVGATPEQMLAQGFRPVGKDFPVFLHPATQEEYALARTERKTAPGYRGFVFHTAPEVTLEEDLVRRDLTINAIARAEDGTLCDPFGGVADLGQRLFRHVSAAFGEDPVRILRLARFAARFSDFKVAPETMALMRQMVAAGEVDALVAERVWQELVRGLLEARPSRMLAVLRDCGALARLIPELEAGADPAAMVLLDYAAGRGGELAQRFACLASCLHGGVAAIDQLCQRLKVPNDCRDLAVMTAREAGQVLNAQRLDADSIVKLLERCDAFRKPQRFGQMLLAVECSVMAAGADPANAGFPPLPLLLAAQTAARGVDAGAIAQGWTQRPQMIADAVRQARVLAVQAALPSAGDSSGSG